MFVLYRFLCALALCASAGAFAAPSTLPLQETVELALGHDSVLAQLAAEKDASLQSAVASAQLPDPKLSLGIENLPTNSLAVGRDGMTMQVIGISQEFPAGHTRALSDQRGRDLAGALQAQIAERRRVVARDVRLAWFELYYALHAQALVNDNQQSFAELAAIAKTRYENGSGSEQEWLRARLELARLQEQALDLADTAASTRATLARWLSESAAARPLPDTLPVLPDPPAYAAILAALPQHPIAQADNAEISAAQTGIEIAKQAYRPSWGLDLSYGHRPGGDMSGPFTDMLSAMVSVSLPLFTGERQDRQVAAARAEANARIYARDNGLRELKNALDQDWARWQQLGKLQALYRENVLPDSQADVSAGLAAYRNGNGDFFELLRTEVDALNARLRQIKIETDVESVKVKLQYLAGEPS